MKKFKNSLLSLLISSLSLFLNFGLINGCVLENDFDITRRYTFTISPDTDQWYLFTSLQQKLDATQIPNDILHRMTTEALADTVLDYPLLANLYAYDDFNLAINQMSKQFNGLGELLKRSNGTQVLYNKLINSKQERSQNILNRTSLEVLLASGATKTSSNAIDYAGYVTTPKGSSVQVTVITSDYSSSDIAAINSQYDKLYPRATRIALATARYNCHSYVWYSTSTSNTYWMNSPSSYMSNGSYSRDGVYRYSYDDTPYDPYGNTCWKR